MSVDMSAKAVTLRLKRVSQLRRLCLSLSKAKLVANKETTRQNVIQTESVNYGDSLQRTDK
jgi:hypothetical protein